MGRANGEGPLHSDEHGLGNRRAFAFAWRVQQPDSSTFQNMSMEQGFEGGSLFNTSLYRDRYGVVVGEYESCTFGWSQGETTLTVDTDVNRQGLRSVRFKNLSFVPGKNQGLEIEVGK
jgi:hypothetical protein